MSYKNIKVKSNTRFILCIDENFEYVYLKDLSNNAERIGAVGGANILEESIEEVNNITGLIENKITNNKRIRNLKIVK